MFKHRFIFNTLYLLIILVNQSSNVMAGGDDASSKKTVSAWQSREPAVKQAEDRQEEVKLARHAGDEWSRQKIRDYLSNNKLNFIIKRGAGLVKDICQSIQPDLQGLEFEFIDPDIVTDDWEDPRLDKYKDKYERFKYGMGYIPNHGPDASQIPSWNINVYDMDTDNDGDVEAILYGERLKRTGLGGLPVSYLVFESNARWMRGGGSEMIRQVQP